MGGASNEMIKLLLNTVGKGEGSSLPPSFRPGDWICPDCRAHNYQVVTCHSVPVSIHSYIYLIRQNLRSNKRTGKTEANMQDKNSCFKCHKPKPQGAEKDSLAMGGGLPPNFRAGDWLCKKCNAHNYASKTACYKCGFVDPDKPSAAAPATSAVNGAGEGKAEESKEDTKSASASGAGAPSVVICVEGLVGDKDLKNDKEYKELVDESKVF
mmetsp:Transcript_18417/g.37173  ORF Transcript_18417/g.37173 Transcript_18417/m.37173 type:complete len:211 (+) Transcript_18417:1066-1698(+)